MEIITIPKKIAREGELVLIPRSVYDELLNPHLKRIKEVELTSRQRKVLTQARKNLSRGKFLTVYELKQRLGIKS